MRSRFEILIAFVVTILLLFAVVGCSNQNARLYTNMVNASVLISDGSGWGSGVFIDDNVIVTAAHVLEHPGLEVELIDGTILEADDFYIDDEEDVGFIFVDANELSIANISMSFNNIGDVVYSVGTPNYLDFKFTLSRGILSHLDRDKWDWKDLLQADIASGPGSSGGPLYNSVGQIIGIIVANPCPNRSGSITLCESAKSILVAYERAKECR